MSGIIPNPSGLLTLTMSETTDRMAHRTNDGDEHHFGPNARQEELVAVQFAAQDAGADMDADADADPDTDTDNEPDTDTDADTGTGTDTNTDTDSDADAEIDAARQPRNALLLPIFDRYCILCFMEFKDASEKAKLNSQAVHKDCLKDLDTQ